LPRTNNQAYYSHLKITDVKSFKTLGLGLLCRISWNSHEHNNYLEMEQRILETNAGKQHSGVKNEQHLNMD
jgi:hypothetical protein